MRCAFALLLLLAAPAPLHALRHGGRVVRAPPSAFSGDTSLLNAAPRPNALWPGVPIYHTAYPTTLSGRLHASSPAPAAVHCVINGRAVLPAAAVAGAQPREWRCDLSFLSFGGLHSVAMYASGAGGATPALLGSEATLLTIAAPPGCAPAEARAQLARSEAALRAATPPATGVLGVYTTTYQQVLSQQYQNVSRDFGVLNSMEDIVRNESAFLADSIARYLPNGTIFAGMLSQIPALGPYCFYRKRASEPVGAIADCPEASRVLNAHADELSAAGFEFIAPDATNWDADPSNWTNGGDVNQLRPYEVLAEEWANARLAGRATPQLSIFDQVNVAGRTNGGGGADVMWEWYLREIFNNATLLDLDMVYRLRDTERVPGTDKVYIVADEENDYSLMKAIQRNNGSYDIVTPLMWNSPFPNGNYERNGFLAYVSSCVSVNAAGAAYHPTTPDLDVPCGHKKTNHSIVGASWTISTGVAFNSDPLSNMRYNGLHLKKQFWDVLADASPTDLLFAPSWNEFAAGPNPMAKWDITNPAFAAAGARYNDPDRHTIWLDGFTSERSRTIEPSVQDGGRYYELFASCMRVYRLQAQLGIVSNGTGCEVADEDCCAVSEDEVFARVHSLDAPAANGSAGGSLPPGDTLLTPDAGEAARLRSAGWRELCSASLSPLSGPSGLCYNASLPWANTTDAMYETLRGPFLLYANTSSALPGALPLVRCVGASGAHFYATALGACGAPPAAQDFVLGYGMARPGGMTIRLLRQCSDAAARFFYTVVDALCLDGSAGTKLLYVV